MFDGLAIPGPVGWLLLVGAVALALFNIGRVARLLRIPQAIGRVVSWLAHIARDAFIQGSRDGIAQIVREELRPNGGSNIRDAVDRTEQMVRHNTQQVRRVRDDLEHHLTDVRVHFTDPDAHDANH